ncbi:MAG: hypothetical protein Pg6C_05950 [Treponemataceae bacterium]|nr:MAG: hypothetical protein Pg6C_05950 [Treponemataceae bacterium]
MKNIFAAAAFALCAALSAFSQAETGDAETRADLSFYASTRGGDAGQFRPSMEVSFFAGESPADQRQ